ncbi:hypothetical protein E0Z10_g4241 [Xylaria hypoxylon]|uniref:SMP-30/Gluconolactonase/LRE-like region domain-containing protein n=1 Tax=Xylaria hypoxylon TaxID=37992 RepID=A0A4Z0Z4P2_9PEZI|nr:hypothetical protein E0Z10_g4241 [Xylaria hypoxylon]
MPAVQQRHVLSSLVRTVVQISKIVTNTLISTLDIGSLYNASVVVYDPYKASVVSTIEFPNITRTVPFHIGGVAWDPYTSSRATKKPADEITILVDAAQAHETAGRDVSGDNYILRWDAIAQKVLWSVNLTSVTRGRYGGPQDIEHDEQGNIYVLGTYPGTLLRIPRDGSDVNEWFVPPRAGNKPIDHAVVGYTGFAADGSTLLVTDARNRSADGGALYRFDMSAAKGTPTLIPVSYPPLSSSPSAVIRPADAIYLPPKYANQILLITEHDAGISVLRSQSRKGEDKGDKWRGAEFLGRIPNPTEITASGGLVVAAIEIAGSVFMIEEWFTDALVPGTSAGNRTSFPLVDITAQLDALVNPH